MENIYVIIYCGYEGIESLEFASTSQEESVKKILELREHSKEMERARDKYSKDELKAMRMSEDRTIWEKYFELTLIKNPDRYCLQRFNGIKFDCVCKDCGVATEETWLY